ncbi:MAG: acyltransferase [Sedimentisphaerales bacterium]|nr:acyltransferase [Sedimentisphaerales bacterium]
MKYTLYKWAVWPKRLSGDLTLGKRVRLFVPLRCDGQGKVYVSERTKMGWPQAPRYGNGCILLQARQENAVIRIGSHCAISNNVSIMAMESVVIEEECLIGELVSIMDSDFHGIAADRRRSGPIQTAPVRIEKNVWLGSRVIVQKGVTIGENSIVAPNAVVTASIPANVIAGGIPARVIRPLTEADHA